MEGIYSFGEVIGANIGCEGQRGRNKASEEMGMRSYMCWQDWEGEN